MTQLDNLHDLDDDIDPALRDQVAKKSTWVSVAVNLVLTIAQVLCGVLAHSQGLVADGIHSLSDLLSDFVVLFANKHSQKAADHDHPYGHQRYENAAAFFLGLMLLTVGVGMLYTALIKLQDPEAIPKVGQIALWVAIAALLAKEGLFRYMLAQAVRVKSTLLAANAWHARSDAASSLLVALGIVGNLFGYPLLDPVAALVVGLLIGKMGFDFAWESLHVLMDRSADEEELARIATTIKSVPGVIGAHDLRTRKMGDQLLVDVHIEVAADQSVKQGHDIALAVRDMVLKQHPVMNVMTHVDPV